MATASQRIAALVGVVAALHSAVADAIVVARVTRRGYIVTDDIGAYNDLIPTSGQPVSDFVTDVTVALEEVPNFHEGRYLAAMQIPQGTGNAVAFYRPTRNDVRGIGQRSGIDGRSEVFDYNGIFHTAWPIDGFVYLNSYRFYTDPRAMIYGRFILCTQEFGHRFGATLSVPAFPNGDHDAGVDAAADATDAADAAVAIDAADAAVAIDATLGDVAPLGDVVTDASAGDARAADGSTGPVALARDALLGRGNQLPDGGIIDRAHWSYFFNTGGSPMEGNNWNEFEPGMFRTDRPTFRFSPLDLYNMGLIPASEVTSTYLIAEPQNVPRGRSRDSAPEYNNTVVTVRGRRVDVSIDDIVRANGPRSPAYPATPRDLDVVWVLLATPEDVSDELAAEFDQAVDSCAAGYAFATAGRGHLVTTVPGSDDDAGVTDGSVTPDDAAPDVKTLDASVRDVPFNPDVPNIPPPDGMSMPDDAAVTTPTPVHAGGGCACSTSETEGAPGAVCFGLAVGLSALCRRSRRRARVIPRSER